MHSHWIKPLIFFILTIISSASFAKKNEQPPTKSQAKYIIIYVWDGLRPDSVTLKTTPNLYRLMQKGTQFLDNHASYPSFTMINAASFATGDRAGKTGFYGNTLWHPGLTGNNAYGKPVDFNEPVFTEDYQILQDLNQDHLLSAKTLFEAAHEKQISTAAIGKSGPAFMQDYLEQGVTLDDKHVYPLHFAKQLQQAGYPLPNLAPLDYQPGELTLASNNDSPTEAKKIYYLSDQVTPDPTDQHGSPYNSINEYMMQIYLDQIIKKQKAQLSVFWMRNPDSTEHIYGPGSKNYDDALRHSDKLLGHLLAQLKKQKIDDQTDIIIVSDHGHSTVSGPLDEFPLRKIKNKNVDRIDPNGFSVSGELRTAALLSDAGFHAYDGQGCLYNPVLSGIKKNNMPLYPTYIDQTGEICGKVGEKYITKSYHVPKESLPNDAIIIAPNGGSDYIYLPSHNKFIINKLVTFFASHTQFDAIFVDDARYGKLPGTIPLSTLGILNSQGRNPDIIVGFSYNENTKINNMPGIEYVDSSNYRGWHGTFSPRDIHNFLIAYGPDFRSHFKSTLPSGNVDVAPTVAHLLGLTLPENDGRILWEALKNGSDKSYQLKKMTIQSDQPLKELTIYDALNKKLPKTQFTTIVQAQVLSQGDKQYYYFDKAQGVRN